MQQNTYKSIEDWVAFLSNAEIPVLQKSIDEIEKLKEYKDRVTVRDLSRIVLDDPMMTLKVMSLLQQYRKKTSVSSEVTTFGRVLMMIGIHSFFEYFNNLTSIEELLGGDENAVDNVLNVIDRSRYAAQYAFDIAHRRFDIDRYEVQIATLLYSTAEIMLWCFSADKMRQIRALSLKYRHMRSSRLQAYVFGFTFNELQSEMALAWKLPELLVELMDQKQTENPRVKTVVIATNLARHSMNGLDDPALPSDYQDIAHLLGQEMEEVLVRVASIRQRIATIRRKNEYALTVGDSRKLSEAYIAKFEEVFSSEEREGKFLLLEPEKEREETEAPLEEDVEG